jgi:hypothetical protein
VLFWETSFQRTYHAFTHRYHAGRANVLWWLNEADTHGLLPWTGLGAGALCAIIVVAGPSTSLGVRAEEELQRRPDLGPHLGQEILGFERPNCTDAVAGFVLDRMDPDRAPFGYGALRSLYGPGFAEFIRCFYLIDNLPAVHFAEDVLGESFREWDHLGSFSFEADLVRRTLGQMPRFHPHTPPAVPPDWMGFASAEEQTFLRRTLVLDRIERLILFLTVYAAMTPWEIAPAASAGGRRLAPKQIELLLKRAWEKSFAVL